MNIFVNLLETRIYRERKNLKWVWFLSFINPIYASIEVIWYLIMWSIWWSSHNFETILFCDMLTVFCIFDLQNIEVTSMFEINIGRLDPQDTITKYSTDKLCNVTPSYLRNNTRNQANMTHVDDQFWDIELRATSLYKVIWSYCRSWRQLKL